ncbi:Uncharacterised protein [Mycobacterium tuberculosis]|nr:Uncharacterised protein [Mycobacterium tuberculosis]
MAQTAWQVGLVQMVGHLMFTLRILKMQMDQV